MDIDKKTKFGTINITSDAIAQVAGNAASQCYGVVGMAQKKSIRNEINELLKNDSFNKGVFVNKRKDSIEVDLYIVVGYGLRITEIASEVQKKVKFDLERTFNISFSAINVYVQGVKSL
ncbi:MAG: Asp23/Gls24 family envelope stress response protein [Bacilli bacterium]|nr:Asp23/Gls24 family envelope stress response protein [Bacillales bacterium]MDY2575171.1 Asp23/Gls24 family envelope stress response protein [Bacilli bacterium]